MKKIDSLIADIQQHQYERFMLIILSLIGITLNYYFLKITDSVGLFFMALTLNRTDSKTGSKIV